MIADQVFPMRDANGNAEWRAIVDGELIAAAWHDKGSALAGLQVEQRRNRNRSALTRENRDEHAM